MTRPGDRSLAARAATLVLLLHAAGTAHAQWVQFEDQTALRLNASSGNGIADANEKDYAYGDLDQDGDIDLVVVRKEPATSLGKRTSILFMNEAGVLVDRTLTYATASSLAGDQGFLTPTNTRDVVLVDVDNDGWLDIVTATTISDGDPKPIGHPRVYRNLGDDGVGAWLGLRYEDARIPALLSASGQPGHNPRFCGVTAGDVTGDGFADLYFSDYDTGEIGPAESPQADFDDKLLINDGTGHFVDATTSRFSGQILGLPFPVSAFGAVALIEDMNGDGTEDIVKQTSLTSPLYVGVAYNDPGDEGFFDTYDVVNNQAPYFVSVGELNNDGKPDLVITDDGQDRYLLNLGNGPDGLANFRSLPFTYEQSADNGFGGSSRIADLDNDGFDDVLITDIDVDVPGCARRMNIYRNLGGPPGATVTLREETEGSGCEPAAGNPPTCSVAGIPSDQLEGMFDVAVFDLTGDGWKDLIFGRCAGMRVWVNLPGIGLAFTYPQGLPSFVPPNETLSFEVQVAGYNGGVPQAGTGRQFVAVGTGAFVESAMVHLGGNLYRATLPAVAQCGQSLRFYFTAKNNGAGSPGLDPPNAPAAAYEGLVAFGTSMMLQDGFEGDTSGWSVVNDPTLGGGAWQAAEPIGTVVNGQPAAPSQDAEGDPASIRAFVTQAQTFGSPYGGDVDGGPTDLISPPLDLAGTDGYVSYKRWFFTDTGSDTLTVWVSANGNSWHLVETVAGQNAWTSRSFRVGQYVTPSSGVRVRFRTSDPTNDSVTEAGLDVFRADRLVCTACNGAPDCDDGAFCNGVESCSNRLCFPGLPPCNPGEICDEANDACVECLADDDCDDGDFCNGAETCSGSTCVTSDPCPGQLCNEDLDACVQCIFHADCADGSYCNGIEICVNGSCIDTADPCPSSPICDEDRDVCATALAAQPRLGQPLAGLPFDERARFDAGRVAFDTLITEAAGLGPTFNQHSCGSCHSTPLGGSGTIKVTRFGEALPKGGGFDPLENLGGSLRQAQALTPACEEVIPQQANVVAERVTNSTLGFGLVEAIPDAAILSLAETPPPGVSGRAHQVAVLELPGPTRVGRFGWKAQQATVLSFSADAAVAEMGLTNRLLSQEHAPNGDVLLLAQCDDVPDPEDGPDAEGFDFIDRVTDFQRFLAPPPQTPRWGMSGEAVFASVGCGKCHARSFVTAGDAALEPFLRSQLLKPYSDFLLHDMGQHADFIAQGDAGPSELRTPPLWGLRVRDPLWHDGRVAGTTFAERVVAAIALHGGVGSEAAAAAQAFAARSPAQRAALVAFLDSLGRAEFDHDGDGDVDAADYAQFELCFGGGPYTPDAPCAVADQDHDRDVDALDRAAFIAAAEGPAGRVPDGAAAPGAPLRVAKAAGGQVALSWSPSCAAGDLDYAIYEGALGSWDQAAPRFCGTSGATTRTFQPGAGSVFYLVVPSSGVREGSYGDASQGARPTAPAACLPQSLAACS